MRNLMLIVLISCFSVSAQPPAKILVYHRATEWRHPSIDDALKTLNDLALENAWNIESSSAPGIFSSARLAQKNVVIFVSTTGDVLTTEDKNNLENFYRHGNGIMAIHAAMALRQHWPFFQTLLSKELSSITGPDLNGVSSPGYGWQSFDEWFHFVPGPLPKGTETLASLTPKDPLTWRRNTGGGRFWFTAMGHTSESYQNPHFRKQLRDGVNWLLASELN